MKHLAHVIAGIIISAVVIIPVCATETENIDGILVNDGNLIEEISYYDNEFQGQVIEQTYFISDNSNEILGLFSQNKGAGWFIKTQKCMEWVSGDVTKIYAKGHFVWNNGKVSVSDESGGYDYIDSGAFNIEERVSADIGGIPFNKYAYVLYKLKFKTHIGIDKDFSVKLTVNASGKTNGDK